MITLIEIRFIISLKIIIYYLSAIFIYTFVPDGASDIMCISHVEE